MSFEVSENWKLSQNLGKLLSITPQLDGLHSTGHGRLDLLYQLKQALSMNINIFQPQYSKRLIQG